MFYMLCGLRIKGYSFITKMYNILLCMVRLNTVLETNCCQTLVTETQSELFGI